MSAFFNLTLDTLAPVISAFQINNGASVTTVKTVTLNITCSDSDVTAMKIWGTSAAAAEGDASWETFAASKTITLPDGGDGSYTVYVKVRDDVHNESSASTASITVSTQLPAITITGPDLSKIGADTDVNVANFSFSSSVGIKAWKVKLVPQTTSAEDAGTQIPTTGGSLAMTGLVLAASTPQSCKIFGTDLRTACGGTDGMYVIKVFGQSAENNLWSA